MSELLAQFSAQMDALPDAVQWWMAWMVLVFALSIIFSWRHPAARLVFVTFFVLTLAGAYGQFYFTKSVHWISGVHLVFWIPLLVYLVAVEMRRADFQLRSFYGAWILVVVATMAVSLAFDARDAVLLVQGLKHA